MPNRADIVKLARSFIGTPFQHQGRLPAIGLDCGGVPVIIGNQLGIAPKNFDFKDYDTYPDPRMVRRVLTENLETISGGLPAALEGDVLLVSDGGFAVHMGILAEKNGYRTIIHASNRDGGVVEHIIDAAFARLIRGVFRARGIE